MKAKIHGVEVEGTPEELVEFKILFEKTQTPKSKKPDIKWWDHTTSAPVKWDIGVVDVGALDQSYCRLWGKVHKNITLTQF